MVTKEEFKKIIDVCASMPDVKEDVFKNHDNNMWWPLEIEDYKKRLLIAGLSTRISYNMINSYRKVINKLNEYSYEQIKSKTKEEIIEIIKGLGLSNTRYSYLSSMIDFIEKYNDTILEKDNDELIELIANNVSGASYKVAQCCVLYMRGYYCGIMPVDSGMKDVELPCIGFEKYGNAIGHDILRKQLQELVKDNNMEDIIIKYGYDKLNIPNYNNATWWAHLVLIYFKRLYCNKHKPDECPLANKVCVSCKCKK